MHSNIINEINKIFDSVVGGGGGCQCVIYFQPQPRASQSDVRVSVGAAFR